MVTATDLRSVSRCDTCSDAWTVCGDQGSGPGERAMHCARVWISRARNRRRVLVYPFPLFFAFSISIAFDEFTIERLFLPLSKHWVQTISLLPTDRSSDIDRGDGHGHRSQSTDLTARGVIAYARGRTWISMAVRFNCNDFIGIGIIAVVRAPWSRLPACIALVSPNSQTGKP